MKELLERRKAELSIDRDAVLAQAKELDAAAARKRADATAIWGAIQLCDELLRELRIKEELGKEMPPCGHEVSSVPPSAS